MGTQAGGAGEALSAGDQTMGPLDEEEFVLSETRKYRTFSVQQKTELVLASLRGQKSIAELGREHEISETLLRRWREPFLAAGAERLSGKPGADRGR
jgi:hypothetical protein